MILIITMITSILPLQATALKASNITTDTLYDNGILQENGDNKYEYVTNAELITALYRLDSLSDYHICGNGKIKKENALHWMRSCLSLPQEFIETFDMQNVCTRESVSVLFYYFAKHLDFHLYRDDKEYLLNYSDSLIIPTHSKQPLSWALQNKILPETYFIQESLLKIAKPDLINAIGYLEPINFAQLETYLINYFLYLELANTYGEEIVEYARQFLGCDYVWGGCSEKGFDCSGFVYYVFSNCGYDLHGRRDGAHNYSTRYGEDIMTQCLDSNGEINWEKVPLGSVIGFDWDRDRLIDHVGIWAGESLIHARGGPNKQYARFGYMVCEFFEGEGDGLETSFDYEFNDYKKNHVAAIRSFKKHRSN